MRSKFASRLQLPLAVAMLTAAGCSSNAVPLPADDATSLTPGAARAAEQNDADEGQPGAEPAVAPDATTVPDVAPQDAPASSFRGTVEQHALTPSYNFFMAGEMKVAGRPQVLILVQTDHPLLCDHLAAGTMPRNATMFAVAMMRADGGEVSTSGKFLAPFDRGKNTSRWGMAYFRHLDDECMVSPLPGPRGAEAEYGTVELLQYTAKKSAQVRYSLTLNTQDVVEGHIITASYCDAPALFAEPDALHVADVDPAVCR